MREWLGPRLGDGRVVPGASDGAGSLGDRFSAAVAGLFACVDVSGDTVSLAGRSFNSATIRQRPKLKAKLIRKALWRVFMTESLESVPC